MIARLFFDALFGDGGSARKSRHVVFAVFDPTGTSENRIAFEETFAAVTRPATRA